MRSRIVILATLMLFIFTTLTGKLAFEQLINGKRLTRAAVMMRSQTTALKEYPRGPILDRNGVPLTDINRGYALFVSPDLIKAHYGHDCSQGALLRQVESLLIPHLKQETQKEISHRLNQSIAPYQSLIKLASDLDGDEVNTLMKLDIPGVVVAPVIKRYRDDGFMAHLLGYVGKGEENQGKSGIEKKYDSVLANVLPSSELVSIVDAHSTLIPGLSLKLRQDREQPHNAVTLTIDKRVQEIVEKVMNRYVLRGAAVVMEVKSGEILALASRPTFNPYDDIAMIIANDPYSSLTNRALSRYHPGSLFKILVAAAALDKGVAAVDDYFDCTGVYTFNSQVSIPCLKKEGHGHIDLTTAFTHSCNPSFITIGTRLGRTALMEYVERFHLTDETLIGYVADHDYSYVDIDLGPAALGNACVGQKGVMVTPLQLTSLIATIADEGRWKAPLLVRSTIDEKGIERPLEGLPEARAVSPAAAKTVCTMMEEVVTAGSGRSAALAEVAIAGKTGTSQTGWLDRSETPAREILNVWFGGYFPANEPQFAIVVLVEDGQSGSRDAAPVFRDIVSGMMELYSMPKLAPQFP